MRASVHVKIPKASVHPDFQKICDEYHIQARGIHGEHSVSTGEDAGVFDISNRRRLGLSEDSVYKTCTMVSRSCWRSKTRKKSRFMR